MSNKTPVWLLTILNIWTFFYKNFRLSLILALISITITSISLQLLRPLSINIFGNILLTIGLGFFVASIFNVIYEATTRTSFRNILSDINPNIQSGVIVHPTHRDVLSRFEALEQYLHRNHTVRIITSTADNYVRKGEPTYDSLCKKIINENCKLHILLYLPVEEQRKGVFVGQRRRTPQELINEHHAFMSDYEDFIKISNGNVLIKFFTLPLHNNYIMIGNERMYSAPILHSIAGRDLPCYEIYPTSDNSLFYKFQQDFDYIFYNENQNITLDFIRVKQLYIESNYQYDLLRKHFAK